MPKVKSHNKIESQKTLPFNGAGSESCIFRKRISTVVSMTLLKLLADISRIDL